MQPSEDFEERADVKELRSAIERLSDEKDDAVAGGDYRRAAELRDEAQALRLRIEAIRRRVSGNE